MAMGENWAYELNYLIDLDDSIFDQEISPQDLEPFLQASAADQCFTGADHDHMTPTVEAGPELVYNTLYTVINGHSCSDDYNGASEHGMSEVSDRNLFGYHEGQDEETPDFPDPLLEKKMKAKRESQTRNRTSNWTEMQTEYLVECKKECNRAKERGVGFAKGDHASNDWNKISKKFSERFAAYPENCKSSKQCRLRWDTLLKAFKKINAHCKSLGIEYTELNKEDLSKLELATTLRKDWYDTIDKFCPPRNKKGKLQKNFPLNFNPGGADHEGSANLSPENAPGSSCHMEVQAPGKKQSKQIEIPSFDVLTDLMQRIVLDFVFHNFNQFDFMEVCRWLALVHDEREECILACVLQLLNTKLILINNKCTHGVYSIKFERMRSYHKFAREVLKRNPNLRIHKNLRCFSKHSFTTTIQHAGLRILDFHKCDELIDMDLKNVPNLKSLTFNACPNLAKVMGWEELINLNILDVTYCPKLSPATKNLKALKYFNMSSKELDDIRSTRPNPHTKFDTRTMTKVGDYLNLDNLRTLENFSIRHCSGLEIVEDSLGSLSSLIDCSFRGCQSLHALPDLSNLRMLKTLDIQDTNIQFIPGLENLNNLEKLNCQNSKVESLPDLSHMQKLKEVQPTYFLKGKISSQITPSVPIDIDDDDTCTDWSDDG